MKTHMANNFAKHILEEAQKHVTAADFHARDYAATDNPQSKASYALHMRIADELRKLHAPACNVLHALEVLIPDGTLANHKDKQPDA